MFSKESFNNEYETDITDAVVCGRKFSFYLPRSIERFIDQDNVLQDFPLWSKLWEASWVLADYVARMPQRPESRLLEVGAGMGMVSIVGASFGHHFTLTEINSDALNFARANARLNQCPHLDIKALDWNHADMGCRFDYIIGSELVYRKASFQPLMNLFKTLLKPGGEIILAAGIRKLSMSFFKHLQPFYRLDARIINLRSSNDETKIVLCRMTPK
jgi:predicted nicotinamide N-methyase